MELDDGVTKSILPSLLIEEKTRVRFPSDAPAIYLFRRRRNWPWMEFDRNWDGAINLKNSRIGKTMTLRVLR